jgi:hypothetical protein
VRVAMLGARLPLLEQLELVLQRGREIRLAFKYLAVLSPRMEQVWIASLTSLPTPKMPVRRSECPGSARFWASGSALASQVGSRSSLSSARSFAELLRSSSVSRSGTDLKFRRPERRDPRFDLSAAIFSFLLFLARLDLGGCSFLHVYCL